MRKLKPQALNDLLKVIRDSARIPTKSLWPQNEALNDSTALVYLSVVLKQIVNSSEQRLLPNSSLFLRLSLELPDSKCPVNVRWIVERTNKCARLGLTSSPLWTKVGRVLQYSYCEWEKDREQILPSTSWLPIESRKNIQVTTCIQHIYGNVQHVTTSSLQVIIRGANKWVHNCVSAGLKMNLYAQ